MSKSTQRSKAEVENMSAEQISSALHAGELEDYLAGEDAPATETPADPPVEQTGDPDVGARPGGELGQVSDEQLRCMSPEEIVSARKEGRLRSLGVAP